MPMRRLILLVLTAFAPLISSCASSVQPFAIRPPQRPIPDAARRPCPLPILPASPTLRDLEDAYVARGAALVSCDVARQLAVDNHDAEHADEAEWLKRASAGSIIGRALPTRPTRDPESRP